MPSVLSMILLISKPLLNTEFMRVFIVGSNILVRLFSTPVFNPPNKLYEYPKVLMGANLAVPFKTLLPSVNKFIVTDILTLKNSTCS